jgi:hypothetical protein
MSEPSHEAQQVCIHLKWGWLPVVMVRKSRPESLGSWGWGRWRMASLGQVVQLNALLVQTWID